MTRDPTTGRFIGGDCTSLRDERGRFVTAYSSRTWADRYAVTREVLEDGLYEQVSGLPPRPKPWYRRLNDWLRGRPQWPS